MKDRYVKLSAIERMAQPMEAFHKGEKPEMEEPEVEEYESEEGEEYESDEMSECPKCGHSYRKGS